MDKTKSKSLGHKRKFQFHSMRFDANFERQPIVGNPTRVEEIRRRAYEIYLERGKQPGGELDDWLQAERELANAVLSRARKRARKPLRDTGGCAAERRHF